MQTTFTRPAAAEIETVPQVADDTLQVSDLPLSSKPFDQYSGTDGIVLSYSRRHFKADNVSVM